MDDKMINSTKATPKAGPLADSLNDMKQFDMNVHNDTIEADSKAK